jgi:hypothetical protein
MAKDIIDEIRKMVVFAYESSEGSLKGFDVVLPDAQYESTLASISSKYWREYGTDKFFEMDTDYGPIHVYKRGKL